MIKAVNLTKRYGRQLAVSDLTFEVRPQEVVGLLGPNGAGKSTTLKILSGYIAPSSGRAEVGHHDVAGDAIEVRRRIGYLPENNPLYEDMSPAEYLDWTGRIRGFSGRPLTKRVRQAVEACDLGTVLSKPIGLLSKGFRQRVGLAAAILHDPEVLLLDEPTSGLDPNQAAEVRALIARLREHKTVLLSTHILSEVEASCDRVVILNHGRIAAEGTPRELALRAGGGEVRLTLKADGLDAAAVEAALRGAAGVESARLERRPGEFLARVRPAASGDDLREALFRLAVKEKWVLLGLEKEAATLANVFKDLTPDAEEPQP